MTPAARLAAAIEIVATIASDRRPASDALKEWGRSHRFAGSGDRAAIAALVYDVERRRASSAWVMGSDEPRALALGAMRLARGLDVETIAQLCDGGRFGPAPLSEDEKARLSSHSLSDAPPHVAGDYPEWLDASLASVFGEARGVEGEALAARAPLDLRVNTLKADPAKAAEALAHLHPATTDWSPLALRIAFEAEGKAPALTAEPAYIKGQVEIQDEGSQIAAILAAPPRGAQVLDLCAGGGGKTLELAALMDNSGQLYAYDSDMRRLAPIHERLQRAGVRNVQVRTPRGTADVLSDLEGRMDLVLVDAPCTGSGTWRRNPDAKWRMRPGALAERQRDQAEVLDTAARFVKPGGRLAYVTCSLLDEENGAQIRAFIARHGAFRVVPVEEAVLALGERGIRLREAALVGDEGLLLTPRRTGTDGFFVSVLTRDA